MNQSVEYLQIINTKCRENDEFELPNIINFRIKIYKCRFFQSYSNSRSYFILNLSSSSLIYETFYSKTRTNRIKIATENCIYIYSRSVCIKFTP